METLSNIKQGYDNLFTIYADERVYTWPLMSNPSNLFLIMAAYLYFVTTLGPRLMENRKPYNLNNLLIIYNSIQIVSCILLFFRFVTSGWMDNLSLKCEAVDYSNNPTSVKLATCVWWSVILKLLELIETIFFILRKKYNQVTVLHVYHHVATLSFTWIGAKYFAGRMTSFVVLLNLLVHTVMYTYYLLSATNDQSIITKISKWKKYITIMQMIQFCIMVAYSSQVLSPSCLNMMPNVKYVIVLFIANITLYFYLFYSFYKKSYKTKSN